WENRRSRSSRFDTSPRTAVMLRADLLDRRRQLGLTPARDEHVGAFVHELLRRREANAAIAASSECNFSFELAHVFLLSCHLFAIASASDPNCIYNSRAQSPEHLSDMVRKPSCEKRGSQAALSWEGCSRHILSFESALSHRVDELLRRYARDVGIGLSCTTGD